MKKEILKEIIMSVCLVIITCYAFEIVQIVSLNILIRIVVILMIFFLVFILSKLITNMILKSVKFKEE